MPAIPQWVKTVLTHWGMDEGPMGVHCGLGLFHFHQMQELIGICGILSQEQPPWALCHVSRANLQFLQCGRVQLSCHGGLCLVSSSA